MMTIDFSHLNLEYLIQARDLARSDPQMTASILSMSGESVQRLATIKAAGLAQLTQIKAPLVIPRPEDWWWARLFQAIRDGNEAEINAAMGHAGLFAIADSEGGTLDGHV